MDKAKRAVDWLINCSEAAMGISSGYYAMINSDPGTIPTTNPETIINFLPKITKHRRIYTALQTLPKADYRKLCALFEDTYKNSFPVIIRHVFEDKVGLALTLYYDKEKLEKLCLQFRHKALKPEDEKTLNELIALTDKEYNRLLIEVKDAMKKIN